MNIYRIKRVAEATSMDGCFQEAIVVARDEVNARAIHPSGAWRWLPEYGWVRPGEDPLKTAQMLTDWVAPGLVSVEKLGVAENHLPENTVLLAVTEDE